LMHKFYFIFVNEYTRCEWPSLSTKLNRHQTHKKNCPVPNLCIYLFPFAVIIVTGMRINTRKIRRRNLDSESLDSIISKHTFVVLLLLKCILTNRFSSTPAVVTITLTDINTRSTSRRSLDSKLLKRSQLQSSFVVLSLKFILTNCHLPWTYLQWSLSWT